MSHQSIRKMTHLKVSNCRPISLLSTVSKVLETIVHKCLFNFFRDYNVITALQSGFVSGDSTENQLIDIYNTFCKALVRVRKFAPYFVK